MAVGGLIRVLMLAVCYLSLFGAPAQLSADEKVVVHQFGINSNNMSDWLKFVDGRELDDIHTFNHPHVNRHMLELFWFQKAARIGGCHCSIEYRASEHLSHARAMTEVGHGRLLAHPIASFESDPSIDSDKLLLSEAIMLGQWFYVGFYTAENRQEILSMQSREEINSLRIGVGAHWNVDRQVLDTLGYDAVFADNWQSLLGMLKKGRVDAMLQPFTGEHDLGFDSEEHGVRFRPISGWKQLFDVSRRYCVSASHPDGQAFLKALNRGISMILEDGSLLRSYQEAGVINAQVQAWQEFQPMMAVKD